MTRAPFLLTSVSFAAITGWNYRVNDPQHAHFKSLRPLHTVRRERAAVGGEGTVVEGMAVATGDDGALLFGKRVDERDHRRHDLLSILGHDQSSWKRTATPKRPPSSTVPSGKKSF